MQCITKKARLQYGFSYHSELQGLALTPQVPFHKSCMKREEIIHYGETYDQAYHRLHVKCFDSFVLRVFRGSNTKKFIVWIIQKT